MTKSANRETVNSKQKFMLYIAYSLLLIVPLLYWFTLAHTPVLGDPTEYTFVAHVLGVAHPPGYAFMTLVSKLFQTVIPLGTIAWRTHLVALTAGTVGVLCVFGIVKSVAPNYLEGRGRLILAALAALTVAVGANYWQHSIHANPHIITAAFIAFDLFVLTKWYVTGGRLQGASGGQFASQNRWLYAFCLSAGLGVTHHPLTVFVLPACVVFILVVHPRILLQWKTLLTGTLFVALGMVVWAYFPLRATALEGTQFPSDMNTWEGFLNIILALRLRENLDNFNKFGAADQWDRLRVFISLLRVQYVWPVSLLSLVGIGWMARQKQRRPLLLLYALAFVCIYAFVMNTVQDVMAYLLSLFLIVGVFAGFGMLAVREALASSSFPSNRFGHGMVQESMLLAALLILPLWNIVQNLPAISLRNYSEGSEYVAAVREQFAGKGEGAALLNQWEVMTPLWYARDVEGEWFDEADVRPIWVSSTSPWLDLVFQNLPAGPVYLNRFERSIFDAGFRLRPRGDLWQVVEPGDETIPPELTRVNLVGEGIELVGYHLDNPHSNGFYALPQDKLTLTLAMRVQEATDAIFMPVLVIDELEIAFTTDSHLLSNQWLPNEVIVEQFTFTIPPIRSGYRGGQARVKLHNLTTDTDSGIDTVVGEVTYGDLLFSGARVANLLANFRQRVGLAGATVRQGWDVRRDVWGNDDPLHVKNGETVHIGLNWRVLAKPEESYTVFVHLIDAANRPIIDSLDYTPLGGASPSHLWIPKWLPGQKLYDPYQMHIADIPPGEYYIEVGLYEQFTNRRLMIYDANGNANSDRIILGKVVVEP